VASAGLAQIAVLANNEWDNGITIEGYHAKPGEDLDPHFNSVSPGYFDTLGIKVLAGRVFTVRDDMNSPRVAVVNASFAKRYFGSGVAVGHRFGRGTDPGTKIDIEIVGVAADTRYESLRDEIPREVYICFAHWQPGGMTAYVRTNRDPETAFGVIRAAVRDLEPNLPIIGMKTLARQLDESLVAERMIATLSSAFGFLATALAILGLYGVMAYMVARRSREIGIRMALGAAAHKVVWLVMRETLILVAAGIGAGLPLAWGLNRLIQAQLYGIEPNDPLSIVTATLLLAAVALLAGYIPARRAAGCDPVRVLRYE
jgi:predicted permease